MQVNSIFILSLSWYEFWCGVQFYKCMNCNNFSADSLADQNGSVDTQKITLTDETRLQPLIDHLNM